VKCVKGLISAACTPEPLEKGVLRARHGLPVFRDGTIRFDMSDVPVTHFRPCEIGTSWKQLKELGYTHDIDGEPMTSDEQLLELYPQDMIPSRNSTEHLIAICAFIDDLLTRFYGLEPFYSVETEPDLVGQLAIGLAPHTSGGVLCRIIGFTNASAGYAHTLFHAAKRRNCDGDEDSIMLLLDGLLNFSRDILPANRGGRMDAPLVLTTRLNPTELDKEALNVDCAWFYDRRFFEATLTQPHPEELEDSMDYADRRIGSIGAVRGYGFTHGLDALDAGPKNSAYKILETMVDKMNAQLELAGRLRSVDVETVASLVVEGHFFPDMRGNLIAFTRQKVRCGRCGYSYRRLPLAGKCIRRRRGGRKAGLWGRSSGQDLCGGNLIMTVSEGAVRKYVKVAQHVMDTYDTSEYTQQKYLWLAETLDGLFANERIKVYTLDDFV
jgi:DNA polymerase II large subunit